MAGETGRLVARVARYALFAAGAGAGWLTLALLDGPAYADSSSPSAEVIAVVPAGAPLGDAAGAPLGDVADAAGAAVSGTADVAEETARGTADEAGDVAETVVETAETAETAATEAEPAEAVTAEPAEALDATAEPAADAVDRITEQATAAVTETTDRATATVDKVVDRVNTTVERTVPPVAAGLPLPVAVPPLPVAVPPPPVAYPTRPAGVLLTDPDRPRATVVSLATMARSGPPPPESSPATEAGPAVPAAWRPFAPSPAPTARDLDKTWNASSTPDGPVPRVPLPGPDGSHLAGANGGADPGAACLAASPWRRTWHPAVAPRTRVPAGPAERRPSWTCLANFSPWPG